MSKFEKAELAWPAPEIGSQLRHPHGQLGPISYEPLINYWVSSLLLGFGIVEIGINGTSFVILQIRNFAHGLRVIPECRVSPYQLVARQRNLLCPNLKERDPLGSKNLY